MAKNLEATGQPDLFPMKPDQWTRPEFLPDWRGCPLLALDTETKDDGLNNNMGPGWAFKDWGHIAGFSVCNGEKSLYFPMRHPESDNFDVDTCHRWMKAHLQRPNGETVFHNAAYDLGWIWREQGFFKPTLISDTMAMAVILDENKLSYSLHNLSKANGMPGKDRGLLNQAARDRGLHPMKDLWRLPAIYVGPYGEGDAFNTFELHKIFKPKLEADDLMKAYRLEGDLVEICVQMRMRGIRIDEERLEKLTVHYTTERDKILKFLGDELAIGRPIDMSDLNSSKRLGVWFDNYNLSYPRTDKGAPSFEADWLEDQTHWLPKRVAMARKLEGAAEKFLTGYIKDMTVDGRVHAEIHHIRDMDERQKGGGTRSYRFSYSNPPLQQMPARDPDIGKSIREVFLPEEGEEWCVEDINQQEPRFTVHYAAALECRGWEKAVHYYTNVPNADYHQMVADLAGIDRKPAKIINLGLAYGMQAPHLCKNLGLSLEDGKELLHKYHSEVPFINDLSQKCEKKAGAFGYIRLIDGARCRFDLWRPKNQWYGPAYPFDRAKELWPDETLGRADIRKAMNRLIQGSSARQTKIIMREIYNRYGYIPMLQMHDDLSFSIKERKQAYEINDVMENFMKLRVPVRVEIEVGPSWGTVKRIK